MNVPLSFPYRKLTEIPKGSKAGWGSADTHVLQGTGYRYKWYELGNDGIGPYLCAIVKDRKTKGIKGEYQYVCGVGSKLFSCSLLTQLAILKRLPNTYGKRNGKITAIVEALLHNMG